MEWYTLHHDESISIVLKPLAFPRMRLFLKNYRICSLKCDITPEDTCSRFLKRPIHSAQYCCDLLHKLNFFPWCILCVHQHGVKQTNKKWIRECKKLMKSRTLRSEKWSHLHACMLPRHVAWHISYNPLKKKEQNKDDHPHQLLEKWMYVEEDHIAKGKADGSKKALYSLSKEV